MVPLAYSDLNARLLTAAQTFSLEGDNSGMGDVIFMPASFYWNSGNWHFNTYESIYAPTGKYDKDETVSLGRNQWTFDTVLAITWFNPDTGTEVSIIPGFMVNTENQDTDYKTGNEFHVDVLFNQFISESVALGLHGYGYKQVTGDSGEGARLGDFKGESWGLGLAISYIPPSLEEHFVLSAKYITDIAATNRLEGDYGILSLSWSF